VGLGCWRLITSLGDPDVNICRLWKLESVLTNTPFINKSCIKPIINDRHLLEITYPRRPFAVEWSADDPSLISSEIVQDNKMTYFAPAWFSLAFKSKWSILLKISFPTWRWHHSMAGTYCYPPCATCRIQWAFTIALPLKPRSSTNRNLCYPLRD
jgi:hypothetical protein